MQIRWHMENRKLWIMVEHTDRVILERLRKEDPRFKRRHIRSVCQVYPSKITLGQVYEMK